MWYKSLFETTLKVSYFSWLFESLVWYSQNQVWLSWCGNYASITSGKGIKIHGFILTVAMTAFTDDYIKSYSAVALNLIFNDY